MKRITLIIAAGLLSLSAGVTYAQEAEADAASMSQLLELIRQGQARDSQEARQREAAAALAEDPLVKSMEERFGAELVPGSIQPVRE